jgi:hypothetical protein
LISPLLVSLLKGHRVITEEIPERLSTSTVSN